MRGRARVAKTVCLATAMAVVFLWGATATPLSEEQMVQEIEQAIAAAEADWTAGMTGVALLTPKEKAALCGALPFKVPDEEKMRLPVGPGALPAHFDWRDNGGDWTTPIRDQGGCGSCWDFSAIGVFESLLEIDLGNPALNPDLSEQYILSCCSSCGSCGGGWPYKAFDFSVTTGVVTEPCMPYQANDAVPCADACGPPTHFLGDWAFIYEDVESIKSAIYYYGPVSACFDVYEDLYYYTGGVYEYVWGYYMGGHAIVIVGWDDAQQYWICKNSWDTDWGESGWFRIRWGECRIEERSTSMATLSSWPSGVVEVTVLDGLGHGVEDVEIYANDDWYGTTGHDGTLALDLIDGLHYGIVAISPDAHLLLYDGVTAPGTLVLDCRDASYVTVDAVKRDGTPLDVTLCFEVGINREYYYVEHTSGGDGWFYITPGFHDFHAWSYYSEIERYDLAFRDVDLTTSTSLTIDASTMPTARWTLDTLTGSYDYLRLYGWPTGFRWARLWALDPGDSLILSAGDWSRYRELVDSSVPPYAWYYEGSYGVLSFTGGEEVHVSAGGDLTLSTWPEKPEYQPGGTATIWIELSDDYGNTYRLVDRFDSSAAPPPGVLARPEDESGRTARSDAPGGTWEYFDPWLTVTPPTEPPIFDDEVWLEGWVWIDLDPAAELGTYEVRVTQQTHLGELEAVSSFDAVEPDPDPYEPNDSCETAYELGTIPPTFSSGTAHFYDPNEDWFMFDVAGQGQLLIETATTGDSSDTVIWLYGACGADPLDSDDDGGPGLASRISYAVPPGTYYLKIDEYGKNYGGATDYAFTLDVLPAPDIELLGTDPITIKAPIGEIAEFSGRLQVWNTGAAGSELHYRILQQEVVSPASIDQDRTRSQDTPQGLLTPTEQEEGIQTKQVPPTEGWDLVLLDPDEPEVVFADIAELYAQISGGILYFRGITHAIWADPYDVHFWVVLDVDQDASTGASWGGIGSETVIGVPEGAVWGYSSFSGWEYIGSAAYVSMPAASNEFAVGVNLDRLSPEGLPGAEGSVDLFVEADDEVVDELDIAPDVGHVTYPPAVGFLSGLPGCGCVLCGECADVSLRVDATGLALEETRLVRLFFLSDDMDETPTRDVEITGVSDTPAVFRVTDTGQVRADETFYADDFLSGGADIAEWVLVSEPVEPGDVLELDPSSPGQYRKARGPCSPYVAGAVSTTPGVVLGSSAAHDSEALLALIGVVPVKACDEGGPIHPGDLLATASRSGYVMRCRLGECAFIVGKAIELLVGEEGLILVLLTR
jgi:hypothetical protein